MIIFCIVCHADSPNMVSSNKRKYNFNIQNNENSNPLKNKLNDANSSFVSNKHCATVSKRAALSDITSSKYIIHYILAHHYVLHTKLY